MSEIEGIVNEMIATAPPGDDSIIVSDIKKLLNNADSDRLINESLRNHYTSELNNEERGDIKLIELDNGIFSVISKFNSKGIKFVDNGRGLCFDYNFINNKVIDIEHVESKYSSLQNELDLYIKDHYVERSCGVIIDNENSETEELIIIINGEKLNDSNYYNGKWIGVYKLKNSGQLSYEIKLRVHYYEDGNVLMNTYKTGIINSMTSKENVIADIKNFENDFEIKNLSKINELNESKFKNLRRLLPISRSKIQWGRSIGNYKLGQDVVGGRN